MPVHPPHFEWQTDMYIVDWVLTLFSKALPLDLAMRVWDFFFFEGTPFIFRVGESSLSIHCSRVSHRARSVGDSQIWRVAVAIGGI